MREIASSRPHHSLRRPGRRLFMLIATLALGACGEAQPEAGAVAGAPSEVSYAASLDVRLDDMERTPTGLYYRDLEDGSGATVSAGQRATVHYTGWLPNGEEFDSSRGGNPFAFQVGAGEVIQGWDEGVAGMQVGGRRQLVIPPDLAYGAAGAGGVIPSNATLVFDVELLQID